MFKKTIHMKQIIIVITAYKIIVIKNIKTYQYFYRVAIDYLKC